MAIKKKYKYVQSDKYSVFRKHFNRTKERNKKKNSSKQASKILTLQDIKDQWEKQDGKCAYTGVQMTHVGKNKKSPRQASLDRIDSSKGYEKHNVQFVCLAINLAKLDFSDKDFREFLKDIKKSKPVV